jgi:hypothetical protein
MLGGTMKKKISILGMLFATLLIEFPIEGFAGPANTRPVAVEPAGREQVSVTIGQPRRRRRRVRRNGRWVWITTTYGRAGNRRYRMVRRYYTVGGVRRSRLVRVYY